MRVLITGGAGFIGSHVVESLHSDGKDLTVLDNLSTGMRENLRGISPENGLRFIEGDIRDAETVRTSMEDVDQVVHLAAIASVPFSINNPSETYDVNVEGTRTILRASVENKIRRVIYASSCAVYGEPLFLPVNEGHRLSATSPYAESKITAEKDCERFRRNGLDVVCLRAFNVYGTRQYNNGYGGVMTHFMSRLMKHQPLIIYGDGEQTRDFLYVDDLVQAISRILDRPSMIDGTYNLGCGKATTINRVGRIIQHYFHDGEFNPIYAQQRPGDVRRSEADITKAKRDFGFEPLVPLEEGLERLVNSETSAALTTVTQRAPQPAKVGNSGI